MSLGDIVGLLFGTVRSEVRILSPRPLIQEHTATINGGRLYFAAGFGQNRELETLTFSIAALLPRS